MSHTEASNTPSEMNQPSPTSYVEALAHLSALTDVDFSRERAAQGVDNALRTPGEPLENLTRAATEVGLKVSATRLTLADAIWKADVSLPIIVWSTLDSSWVVIEKHGLFSAKVSSPTKPRETERLSRSALATRLGLDSAHQVLELGVISPLRPVENATAHNDHHHHTHHLPPLRRFLSLMRPEMSEVWTIILFSLVTGLLYLALPLAINALVSNVAFGTQSGPFLQALLVLAAVLLICLALAAVLRGLQYYTVEVIQRRLFVRMTADLSYRIPRVDLRSIDGVNLPELVNRFLDVVTMQKNTALLLLTGINLILSTIIGMTVLGFYHPILLAFSLILLTVLSFIIFVLGRGAIASSIAESLCKYGVVGWLEELARYPRLFKGPGGYDLAAHHADDLARDYLSARRRHFRILMRQIIGLLTLEVIASAALLTVGGWLVLNQQLTLGQLVAAEIIVTAIVASISKLGKQFEAWYDTLAAVDKIGHLVDLEVERENGDSPLRTATGARVEVKELCFSYSSGKPIFSKLSFDLAPGDRVALFGPQGSGSSTVLDLLHGLRIPTAGHILIDRLDLRSWYLECLRSQVTLIRSGDLVNGTIADNVRLGHPDVSIYEVNAALRRVGLLQDVLALPEGIQTELITGGLPLSSRQRIRLLIARALVCRPRLLLLDEVLDGLDSATLAELASILMDPEQYWTVIIATREENVLRQCQRTINLNVVNAAPSNTP
jgi:ABC-type bacteriocin/lantibiotic exporter with double-glycine peptidase domain